MLQEYKIDEMMSITQRDIEDDFVEIQSDNSVPGNTIRHNFRSTSNYINLSDSYFQVNFSITANSNTKSLTSGIMSLFQRAVLRLNGVAVEQIEYAHLVNHVVNMLKYSDDHLTTQATSQFIYKDTGIDTTGANAAEGAAGAITMTAADGANLAYNHGYVLRVFRTASAAHNKVISCVLPLSSVFQIATLNRVIYGTTVETELVRSPLEECIFGTGAGADATLALSKISLWLNKRLPDVETSLSLMSAVNSGISSKFNYLYHTGYLSAPLGAGRTQFRVVSQVERLESAFVIAFPDAFTQVVSKVRSLNVLQDIEMVLDNRRFPVRKFESMDEEEGKARAYNLLCNMLTKGDTASSLGLDFGEYSRSTVVGFSFAGQDNVTGSGSVIEVNAKVSGACRLFVVLVSEREIELSYAGESAIVTVR